MAPTNIKIIEINLTAMMTTCKTFVFYILLNEKAAPDKKKTPSQN